MSDSDAKKTMECIGGKAECDKISKATLKNWVVNDFSILLPSLFLSLFLIYDYFVFLCDYQISI